MLAHNVYFTLKDRTDESRNALIAGCREHLTGHPNVRFFACGTLASELNRPVNDRDFDVALHLVFDDQEAHDRYQDSARHTRFVDENQSLWARARVFDSIVES